MSKDELNAARKRIFKATIEALEQIESNGGSDPVACVEIEAMCAVHAATCRELAFVHQPPLLLDRIALLESEISRLEQLGTDPAERAGVAQVSKYLLREMRKAVTA